MEEEEEKPTKWVGQNIEVLVQFIRDNDLGEVHYDNDGQIVIYTGLAESDVNDTIVEY